MKSKLKSVPIDHVNLSSQVQNCLYRMIPFHTSHNKIFIYIRDNDLYITSSNNLITSFQYEFRNSQPYEDWAYQFMLNSTRWPLLELNTLYYEDLSHKV